ncbi:MAG: D-alanine--poly(phosphoribitol) ligase subunit DltA [Lactobacillales bacterium]|nr:D-alanine--poly(phosphoribitol) ligase subunit DltA [Lactobacillales bacterium]
MNSVIKQIDSWASVNGEALAFESSEERATYKELKRDSDKIAKFLLNNLSTRGAIVVIEENEYLTIATFLGCVKSGHAYIPVDGGTASERMEKIIELSKPAAVINLAEVALDFSGTIYTKETFNEVKNQKEEVESVQETFVQGEENFYIIYTSGTTGDPKGVQISNDNLWSFVDWVNNDFELSNGQRFLSQAPYSFDLSVMSLYPALCSGGTVVALKKEETVNYKVLFELLPKLSLDVWVSTPSFVEICLMSELFNEEHLPTIQHFLFCGEELMNKTAQKLLERFPSADVWNTYGPTEATVAMTQVKIDDKVLATYPRLPIGKAKRDTEVYIVDELLNPLPTGEMGEIIIIGPGVSKGYLNNEEKTKSAFFTWEGKPAYRTGDKGFLDEAGMLFYRGRLDFQVKLNGYRIELQDIESHLVKGTFVEQAIVLPEYDEFKVKRLVACVVPAKNDFAKEFQLSKAIKGELKEWVMDYMIPGKFSYFEQFPLTQNGKVDRKALEKQVFS